MRVQDNPCIFADPESYLISSVLINKFNFALLGKTRTKKNQACVRFITNYCYQLPRRTPVGTKYEQRLNYGGHGISTIKMQTLSFTWGGAKKKKTRNPWSLLGATRTVEKCTEQTVKLITMLKKANMQFVFFLCRLNAFTAAHRA